MSPSFKEIVLSERKVCHCHDPRGKAVLVIAASRSPIHNRVMSRTRFTAVNQEVNAVPSSEPSILFY